jgi:hypothetical protein
MIPWYILTTYILIETQAVPQWARLLRLKFLKYNEYFEFSKSSEIPIRYSHFLLLKYNNFFISLITCSECLLVWLNIIGTLIMGGWMFFGVNCLSSILGLASFKFILKKLYE